MEVMLELTTHMASLQAQFCDIMTGEDELKDSKEPSSSDTLVFFISRKVTRENFKIKLVIVDEVIILLNFKCLY